MTDAVGEKSPTFQPWQFAGRAKTFVLLVFMLMLACVPILASPVIPAIDLYDHINRYFVLENIEKYNFIRENYIPNWSLIPNIGLDLLASWTIGSSDTILYSKYLVSFIFAVQYFGIVAFQYALSRKLNWVNGLFAIPLLYSFVFTWGFANFLLGLGLVFWGAALWLMLRDRLVIATLTGIVVALIIFLTHGVAFVLYGLLLGAIELGVFWTRPTRLRSLLIRMMALSVLAVAPAIMFLFSVTAGSGDGISNAPDAVERLADEGRLASRLWEIAQYRLQTVLRVSEGPSAWFDASTFVLTVLLIGYLVRRGRLAIPRVLWPAIAIGLLLVIATPPAMFGVGYVADRIPLYVAMLVAGGLTSLRISTRSDRAILAVLLLLVFGRLGYIALDWRWYAHDFTDYSAVASKIPRGKVVSYVNVKLHQRDFSTRRCEMYGPLLISLYGQASPLFAIPTAQPLKLAGKLEDGLANLPKHRRFSVNEAREYYNTLISEVGRQRHFEYVLICNAADLQRAFPAGMTLVASGGRFTLLKVGGG